MRWNLLWDSQSYPPLPASFWKLNELRGKEAVENVIELVVGNKNKPLETLF